MGRGGKLERGIRTGLKSYANAQVLEFYKTLPFNYYSSVEKHGSIIRKRNPVKTYSVLPPLLKRGTRVIDVGCGTGWLANCIAYYYPCQVTGIDFNPVAINRAREAASYLKVGTEFWVGDLFLYQPREPFDFKLTDIWKRLAQCKKYKVVIR